MFEKEDKSNKVILLSSFSTNTQYPSAKVVFDVDGDYYAQVNINLLPDEYNITAIYTYDEKEYTH